MSEKEKALREFVSFCLRPQNHAENVYRVKEQQHAQNRMQKEDKYGSRKRVLPPSETSFVIRPPVLASKQSSMATCYLGLRDEDLVVNMRPGDIKKRRFDESSSTTQQPQPLMVPQPPILPPRDSDARPNPRTQRHIKAQAPPPIPPSPPATLPPLLQRTPMPPPEPAPPALPPVVPRPVRRGFLSSLRPGFLRGK
jgi:hypothetical protein